MEQERCMTIFTYEYKIDEIMVDNTIIPDVHTRVNFVKAIEIHRKKYGLPKTYRILEYILEHKRKDIREIFENMRDNNHQFVLNNFDTICGSFIDK